MFNGLTKSLGARIAFLMSLAMLPLGLISIYQTSVVVDEAQDLSKAALLSETVAAASGERELIQQALGAAQGLASAVARVPNEACVSILQNFIDSQRLFVFASFVAADGKMNCSSNGAVRDFAGTRAFEEAISRRGPAVEMLRMGPLSRQSVITAAYPVRSGETTLGVVSISIPHSVANALMENPLPSQSLKLASVNMDGDVISSTSGIDAAEGFLPADMPLKNLVKRVGTTFRGTAGDGEERFFAVAPMIDDVMVLVGSWPVDVANSSGEGPRARMAVIFPGLMWLAGIAVAFFGLQRLVVRHIRQLRSAMRQFALGERRQTLLQLDDPPEEIEEAQRAFNRMALILTEAEARQEKDLRDKEVLLKEVHHRVKNNLQMIASIMNMQARSARSSEARHMLAGLQRRVRGLAMLHRTLYTTPDLTTVNSEDLVRTVLADVGSLSQDDSIRMESNIASVALFPDQAVPLSMLVTEALTNAHKYVGTNADGTRRIMIDLTETGDGNLILKVINTVGVDSRPMESQAEGDGLGSRLMTAFIRQLDGTATQGAEAGRYVFEVTFPRRDFTPPQRVEDAA